MGSGVSRRHLLEGAIVAAGVARIAAPAAAQEVSEAQKVSHADARYQPHPNGQQRCAICLQFEPPDKCKIVRSPISPNGWCQFFAARENAH
jgi:hypothetical protein